jgi:hypothetical protein
MADGAPGLAARYLRRALDEPPDARVRAEVLLELARAETAAGEPTAADSISAALDSVAEPDDRVRAVAELGRTPSAALDRSAVVEASEQGLLLARHQHADPEAVQRLEAQLLAESREDLSLRPRAHAMLGSAGATDDDSPAGRALMAQRALEAALAGRPARDVRDLAEHALGRGALLAEDRPGGPHVSAAIRALTYADDLQSAELALAMALQRARDSGSPEAYARVCGLRADVALRRGSLSDAIADARAALDASPGAPDPRAAAILSTALLERSGPDAAAAVLRDADPGLAEPAGAAALLAARARLALAAGDHAAAAADALAAGERQRDLLADAPTVLDWRTEAALALATTDRPRAVPLAAAQLPRACQRCACDSASRCATAGEVEGGEHGIELLQPGPSRPRGRPAPRSIGPDARRARGGVAGRAVSRIEGGKLLRVALACGPLRRDVLEARVQSALREAASGWSTGRPPGGEALTRVAARGWTSRGRAPRAGDRDAACS